MRRRQQPHSTITDAAGTTSPLPPPSAAATRSEVTALGDQVSALREQFEVLARTLSNQMNLALDAVDASLHSQRTQAEQIEASLRSTLEAVQARAEAAEAQLAFSMQDRVARLTVDQEVAISAAEGRMASQVGAATAQQHTALNSLAGRFDDAARQIAEQVQAQAQRSNELADTVRHEVATSVGALRAEVEEVGARAAADQSHQFAEMRDELSSLRTTEAAGRSELQEQLAKVAEESNSTTYTMMKLKDRVAEIDVDALDLLRAKVSSLAGETTLVRIEMDRLTGSIDDRFDRLQLRLTDVESMVESDADVSAAVQSERLDEMERALAELDPSRFVSKDDLERGVPALHSVPDYDSGGHSVPDYDSGGHSVPDYASGGE